MGKTEDKRLSIDLISLRQDIWTRGDEEVEILRPKLCCDKIRWIDASVMAADCSTKAMPNGFLVNILTTGTYDIAPDPVSTIKKARKQLARARVNNTPTGK
eukprot:2228841-Pyramimonas_sp.AAC.1